MTLSTATPFNLCEKTNQYKYNVFYYISQLPRIISFMSARISARYIASSITAILSSRLRILRASAARWIPVTPSGISLMSRPFFIVNPDISCNLILIIAMFFYKDNKLIRYIGVEGSPPRCAMHPPSRKRPRLDRGGSAFRTRSPDFLAFSHSPTFVCMPSVMTAPHPPLHGDSFPAPPPLPLPRARARAVSLKTLRGKAQHPPEFTTAPNKQHPTTAPAFRNTTAIQLCPWHDNSATA